MLVFVERLVGAAGVDSDGAVGIVIAVAEVVRVRGVFKVAGSNEEMRAAYVVGPLNYFIPVFVVVGVVSELLICEVGGDVEEGVDFG